MRQKLAPVFPELNGVKMMKGDSSYTINKYKMFVCVKDKRTNEVYDDNMLTYVILHELAHSITPEVGHTPLFFSNFNALLTRAENQGLYDSTKQRPLNYCE